MSPLSSLIDHSHLLNRVQTLYSFAPAQETFVADERAAVETAVEQDDERTVQIKGLISGTLLFMPFLLAYVVACGSR